MSHDYYDYYAYLDTEKKLNPQYDEKKGASCLASGFVDQCIVLSNSNKEEALDKYSKFEREQYSKNQKKSKIIKQATVRADLKIPEELNLEKPDSSKIPSHWLSLEIPFTLQTPWYSKDDKPFHILDNPLHKDKVFGVPFMPASAWKGLLRWACRMQAGLLKHLEKDPKMDHWKDPDWMIHLFGNEKEENENFNRGAVVFYPTWFSKIGFEVINPHSRKTRAGKNPILYEVVPAGTTATLYLLYAPMNIEESKKYRKEALKYLVTAIEQLLTIYGFSAKRTAGWGIATVDEKSWKIVQEKVQNWLGANS
jgi:CRISPR-associated protein Cmr2